MCACVFCMYVYIFIDEKTTRLYFLFSYLPDMLEIMCKASCKYILCMLCLYFGREFFHSCIVLML